MAKFSLRTRILPARSTESTEPRQASRDPQDPPAGFCFGRCCSDFARPYFYPLFTTEAIAECIRSGGVWETESNMELFDLVPIPAAADWDAPFTVKRINL
jgi:hypothetical protein